MAKEKKENPTELRLKDIEKEISELSSERDELKAHWLLEKDLIGGLRKMKEEAENLKTEADEYERKGELGKVAEIRYGRLVETEKKIQNESAKLNDLQKTRKMLK